MFEIIKKEKLISYEDETLPPCWVNRGIKQIKKENNYFNDSNISETIWVSGNDGVLLNELIKAIDAAKEMICLASYIFSEPEIKEHLLNASKRGVRVYLLTASNKHLKNQPDEDDDFNKRMYNEMDKLFKELQGKIKIRTSENFHTKFLLVDPLNPEIRKGYLLTANFDTKGLKGRKIDGHFRVNPEICVQLAHNEINSFFNQFCYGFWEKSTEESKRDGFLPITKRLKKKIVLNNILINSINHKSLENAIIELIDKNPGNLIICTYGINDDNKVFQKILSELKKGRNITILTRPRNKNMNALIKISNAGAIIIGHHDIHAKTFIIENENEIKGLIMTGNIENISFDKSFESGKLLTKEESVSILKILKEWIKYFPLTLEKNLKRNQVKKEVRVWNDDKKEIEKKNVIDEEIINIELTRGPKSIKNYEEFEISKEELKKPDENQKLFKKIRYRYEIKPPILPKTAKPYKGLDIKREEKNEKKNGKRKKKSSEILPIYKTTKDYYIVVKEKTEIKEADILAEKYNAQIVTLEKYVIS